MFAEECAPDVERDPSTLNDMIRNHHWWPAFQERCPGWKVFFTYMEQDEILDFDHKIIWLRVRLPDPLFRWAHATAHVMSVRRAAQDSFGGHPFTQAELERRIVQVSPACLGFDGAIREAEEVSADLAAMCWASYSPPLPVLSDVAEVA